MSNREQWLKPYPINCPEFPEFRTGPGETGVQSPRCYDSTRNAFRHLIRVSLFVVLSVASATHNVPMKMEPLSHSL